MDRLAKSVAIYTMVATKGQDVQNQLIELRDHCRKYGYSIYQEYTDNETGKAGCRERAVFDQLFKDAAAR